MPIRPRLSNSRPWSVVAIVAGIFACSDPGGGVGNPGTTGSADETAAATTEAAEDTSGTSGDSGSSEHEGSEDSGPSGALARGIDITSVEANQGVGVAVVDGTAWVGPDDRNARILRDRSMLIRVQHQVEDGWEPRTIEAVLELDDGTAVTERRVSLMVDGDSHPDDLEGHFNFRLESDEVPAGLRFRVRLEEAPGTPGVTENPDVLAPAQLEPLGVEDVSSRMDIVLYPVEVEGCDAVPRVDSETIEPTLSRLFGLFPIQGLGVDIRDPLVVTQGIDSCVSPELVDALTTARAADDAGPDQVYVAVYDRSCLAKPLGCYCSTYGIGSRALQIEMIDDDPDSLATWIDNCTALALGRRNVSCTGGEGGPDPAYPYPNGEIGGYGYSVETQELHPPSTKTFLSLCEDPTWVSDYGWNLAYDALRGQL